jgi:hypothetical protein
MSDRFLTATLVSSFRCQQALSIHRQGRAGLATLLLSASIFLKRGLSVIAVFRTETSRRGVSFASMKSSGRSGPHWIEPGAIEHVIACRLPVVEQVAVRVMLMLLAPRIAPVVEDLTAEEMSSHAPGVTVLARHQHLLAHFDGVQVDDLESDVIDLRFKPQCDEQRMMVPWLAASVESHESADRVPSGRHMTSDGMKPSVPMYQRTLLSKSGVSRTR